MSIEPTARETRRLHALLRRAELAVGPRLLRAPEPLLRRVVARRPITIDGRTLDPQAQWILFMMKVSGQVPLDRGSVARARREYRRMHLFFGDPPVPLPAIEPLAIPGPAGPIPARVYRPSRAKGLPIVLYFHGGGGVIGDLDTHDGPCRIIAQTSGHLVVAIDYRLAPEHRFPAAPDDAFAALRWMRRHAAEIGGDPEAVSVAGDSYGGTLSAVVCHMAREAGDPQPRRQVLVYPATDRVAPTRSRSLFGRGLWLTDELLRWFESHGLNEDVDLADVRVSPLRAGDFTGLAPATVITAGFDPLYDEGIAYAERLRAAGVPVRERCHEGLVHDFVKMTGVVAAARRAVAEIGDDLRRPF